MSTLTLKDVAREAGVSIATVSRFFNDVQKVRPDTRDAVQRAVDALGYRPSRVARRLRVENGRSHLFGLVIPDMQNPFFTDVARGVEDVAQAHGYSVLLANADEIPEKENRALAVLRDEQVDGIILPTIQEGDDAIDQLLEHGVPTVCVDRKPRKLKVDTIGANNEQGAFEATDLLLSLGHTRIGYVGGIPHLSTSVERLEGFHRAHREHGLTADEALIRAGNSRQESGRTLAAELLALPDPPTALFAGNNLMTLGALEAIYAEGLRIPHDVALVAYDDLPWARAINPPLTAVSQPGADMGRRAAQMLLERIANRDDTPRLVTLQPQLIVRASHGGPRHPA